MIEESNGQLELLEGLVIDNPDLERLEGLLDQFNIFEAVGVVRQELRHSDFLAFLLNPQQPHGLGDVFLKNLLQKILQQARGADLPINLIDLDVWSLEETTVQREWRNIDILLLNEEKKLAVIIENKVDALEQHEQLDRYYKTVRESYQEYSIVGIFLTPEGDSPSDKRFLTVSYCTVADLVESLVKRRESTLGLDIKTVMTHYAQMLRRHIVSESEIAELCRKIYRKHQRALDLIFEHRPSYADVVLNTIERLVEDFGGLVLDKRTSNWVSFAPEEWDTVVGRNDPQVEHNWSVAGRILLFWVDVKSPSLRLVLEILPGPTDLRQRLFDIAQANKPPFRPGVKKIYPLYCRIWNKVVLGTGWQEKYDDDELEMKVSEQWTQFVAHDLPKIREIIETGMKEQQ